LRLLASQCVVSQAEPEIEESVNRATPAPQVSRETIIMALISVPPMTTLASIHSDWTYESYRTYYSSIETAFLEQAARDIVARYSKPLQDAAHDSPYRLDKVLQGMLEFAPCDSGKRYVCVVICVADVLEEGVFEALVDVAKQWVDCLLLPSTVPLFLPHLIQFGSNMILIYSGFIIKNYIHSKSRQSDTPEH